MPTVSTAYDIKSLIEHHARIQVVSDAIVRGVREYHSNCPWCDGKDRFITRPETGQYTCAIRSSGCGRYGDGIDFLMEYVGMSRGEAIEELALEDVSFYEKELQPRQNSKELPPSKKWQEAGLIVVDMAEHYLWNTVEGRKMLDYLHQRGLNDDTIRHFRFGAMLLNKEGRWYQTPFERWGLDPDQLNQAQRDRGGVRVPPGIVIPYFEGDQLWKIAVKVYEGGEFTRYGQVMGSSEGMFNIGEVELDKPAMMVEAEFCAASVWQEARDLVACVATGSADRARIPRWRADLMDASFVLQSFDEDQAGDTAAEEYWQTRLEKCLRWTPGAVGAGFGRNEEERCLTWMPGPYKDPNDILKAQQRGELEASALREWVEAGLHCAAVEFASEPSPDPEPLIPTLARVESPVVAPAQPETVVAGPDRRKEFDAFVAQVVEIFGGPDRVKIQEQPPGLTLEQYHQSLPKPPYQLRTLPPLPRDRCPHTVLREERISDRIRRPVAGQCRAKPLAHGWCQEHARSHELLSIGAMLGYPMVNIGSRGILSGCANWEAYAERVSAPHAVQDMATIRARYGVKPAKAVDKLAI